MTGVAAKLGGFAVVLAVVFGGSLALGAAAGPAVGAPTGTEQHEGAAHEMDTDTDGGHETGSADAPGGLAVSQDGYTLAPASTSLEAGREQDFRFTITGPDSQPLRDYDEEHDQELHLIVVRRDLSGFQHVHPERDADGTWSIPLTLAEAGEYRAFADFVPAGGEGLTLGVDLRAAGDYAPEPLPSASRVAEVDGYTVELTGDLVAGTSSDLTLTVSRDGEPVTDLEPYLGAYGHLVALRQEDLAYLHVHPDASTASWPSSRASARSPHGEPGDGTTTPGPDIDFAAEVPTAGTYRLYLDFSHDGVVRTAELTATTEGTAAAPADHDSHEDAP